MLQNLNGIRKKHLRRQIAVLTHLNEVPNIQKLRDIIKDPKSNDYCLISDIFDSYSGQLSSTEFSLNKLQSLMRQLFVTVDQFHARGVIHRNLSNESIVFKEKENSLQISKFEHSDFYIPNKHLDDDVGYLCFKAPETFMKNYRITYAVDIWAIGILLASLVRLSGIQSKIIR